MKTTTVLLILSILLFSCAKEEKNLAGNYRKDYDNGYYEGDFNEKGERHGIGTFYYDNGNKYEGQWVNGYRTGQGTFTWANGDKYEGQFVNGYLHGNGTIFWANGDKYEGQWVDDSRTGQGTYFWANGDKYEGDFVQGNRTGNGIMTWKDGTRIVCKWNDGAPVDTDNKTFATWAIKWWYFWNDKVGVINPDYYNSASALLSSVRNNDEWLSTVQDANLPESLFFSGKEIGYGFGIRSYYTDDIRVAWVHPNSPAAKEGIKRGYRIDYINGEYPAGQNIGNLYTESEGNMIEINVSYTNSSGGGGGRIRLTSQKYDIASVLYQEVIQTPSKKVGYLVLRSFVEPNENEIMNAISTLANANIQELILDLRYCSGGHYETLQKTASLLAPTSANGKVFLNRNYNKDRSSSNYSYLFEKTNSLNMSRIIVLTTQSTTNTGEWLIAGLQPYCNIVQLGTFTGGGDIYGTSSWTLPDQKEILRLVTSIVENSAGNNTLSSLQNDYYLADGLDKDWGDRDETMLQGALYFIENGYIPYDDPLNFTLSQPVLPVIHEPVSPVEPLKLPNEVITK